MRAWSELGLNLQIPVNESYRKAVGYRSYRLIHKFQRIAEDASLKLQNMRKKIAVQMKHTAFSG